MSEANEGVGPEPGELLEGGAPGKIVSVSEASVQEHFTTPPVENDVEAPTPEADAASQSFVGRWNRLVSTTNWEKGRIIIQWREALVEAEAPAADYSDEAWSRRVGGVTGQHVGRLRRVYQRFGTSYEQYPGLYWSHFQAAVEWDDAEMWLEGAVQSGWSVSQLRRQRWETLGGPPETESIVAGELDEDFEPALRQSPDAPLSLDYDVVQTPDGNPPSATQAERSTSGPQAAEAGDAASADPGNAASEGERSEPAPTPVQPFADLPELPEDFAEAFEAFKLVILHHKTSGWNKIAQEDVLSSLDALKQLVLAPAGE